ncbi:mucin-2-like isoform X2 [Malaya genurostris]|uniref:mucin-2-like isoform X2 n=1 Tax=Malaya genurostris TaxID=325434 RepID=UPI0026F3EDDB|nr:mucin-2-like isoform X2 [Malaya genurostris]
MLSLAQMDDPTNIVCYLIATPCNSQHMNGINGPNTIVLDEMKDALQEELRNTLKRKVKKHDVEQGNGEKNNQIEKSMTINRTEVQLKVNTSVDSMPVLTEHNVIDNVAMKSLLSKRAPVRNDTTGNDKVEKPTKSLEYTANPVLEKPPTKPETAIITNNAQISQATFKVSNCPAWRETPKQLPPTKITTKPKDNFDMIKHESWKKTDTHQQLQIEINPILPDDCLKNSILSSEVKSGNASIKPSQIRTLTKQGSHVSHTDIVESPKQLAKCPISLLESPTPFYSPPTSQYSSPSSSGPSSPRTPTRTTILDTKISYSQKTSSIPSRRDPNVPMKKLMISHPKASFTLPRTYKRQTRPSIASPNEHQESKPVFKILTNLEQTERREETAAKSVAGKQQNPINGDSAGAEPVLTSYVSFAKDLGNAANNFPDTAKKTTTVGVVKQDLFYENRNLRNVKFDIVENGQLRVVDK